MPSPDRAQKVKWQVRRSTFDVASWRLSGRAHNVVDVQETRTREREQCNDAAIVVEKRRGRCGFVVMQVVGLLQGSVLLASEARVVDWREQDVVANATLFAHALWLDNGSEALSHRHDYDDNHRR